MHILDDPSGLSLRAQRLLDRTGRRDRSTRPRLPTELLRVRDRQGRLVPAPAELVIRREGFAQRFGGLRYTVRRSHAGVNGERRERADEWSYELGTYARADPEQGWYFDWFGPSYASPIRCLARTDGRVGAEGASGDGVFQETETSVLHRIESDAVRDEVSAWDPWPIDGSGLAVARQLDGLSEVAEASGPMQGWRMSDVVAVMEFAHVSHQVPRERAALIWCRGEEGHRRVRRARAAVTLAEGADG